MKKTIQTAATAEELLEDLRALVADAEKIVGHSPDEDDTATTLRHRFAELQARFGELIGGAKDRIAAGAQSTDALIRANLYHSLAIALGAGLLIGTVIGRRKSRPRA